MIYKREGGGGCCVQQAPAIRKSAQNERCKRSKKIAPKRKPEKSWTSVLCGTLIDKMLYR